MALGYIGTLTLRLEMPWVATLKEKRALVRPIVERVKSRFPVSVARLDGLDTHDWEVVGVVTISNDAAWVEETLRHVADFFAVQGEYSVTDETLDVYPLDTDGDADD